MSNFFLALGFTLSWEGGFTAHALDTGGETMYGITEEVARANGYEGEMKDLTQEFAIKVYEAEYWRKGKCHEVGSQAVSSLMFDCSVNHGVKNMVRILQRALNNINTNKHYLPLEVDGVYGQKTREALEYQLSFRRDTDIVHAIAAERVRFYLSICDNRPEQKVFLRGWQARIFDFVKRYC